MTRIYTRSIGRRQQRGVILLAIISLLTMFMLIGITYVVVSGHFKRAAITNSQARQLGVPPQKHLDSAMYQLLRDTELTGSAVRGHSLLQDKYGHFSIKADVSNFSGIADGQILRMEADLSALPPTQWNNSFLNGRVITFMDGDNKNISGRILKSAPLQNSTNHVLHILFPKYFNISGNTSKILINGRDFSGTGFGLVANAGNPRYGQLSVEALLPNRSADTTTQFSTFRRGGANEGYDVPDYQNMAMAALLSNPNPANRGLDFVIPSFHRPALINYWRQQGNAIWQNNRDKVLMRPMPWPGQHPNFTGSNPHWRLANGGQDVLNQNNQNALLYGPWDIDNDGDGHPDSVWVDMGFPIQTDSSGRQYKPLFAILCTDMDGRLNLNAHGNQMHYLANTTNAPVQLAGGGNSTGFPRGSGFGPAEINLGSLFSQTEYRQLLMGVTGQTPGRYKWDSSPGLTANPAINFNGIDYFSYFIFGHHPPNFSIPIHRYTSFQSMPDIHGELAHGINRSGNVVYEVSQTPTTGPLSTAPNVAGLRHTIVDNPYELNMVSPQASDQLFTAHELEALLRSHDPDNPYTYNSGAISGNGASRIYKLTNSFDANPNATAANRRATAANRRSVTSASFDPPVPSVQIPKKLRQHATYGAGSTFVDLLRARIKLESPAASQAVVDQRVASLRLPSTLIDGLKMNVNRPFGNGVDDLVNGLRDGVVDNFIETGFTPTGMDSNGDPLNPLGERLWPLVFGNANKVWFDHDNDGVIANAAGVPDRDAFLARHHYARQLYVLMLLMKDQNRQIDFDNNGTVNARGPDGQWGQANRDDDGNGVVDDISERGWPGTDDMPDIETAYHLAQWAVNVVDFRDADSIMTPFEFDLNPFNGWHVDGNINTLDNNHRDRAVVWGTERPELLITESFAFHDRRTEDLDNADTGNPLVMDSFQNPILNNPPVPMPDGDFDQRLLPRSGVFFELYNPWQSPGINAGGNPTPGTGSWAPAEFYRGLNQNVSNGVILNQLSHFGSRTRANGTKWLDGRNVDIRTRSPVWRMIIVRGANANRIPGPDDRSRDPDGWYPTDDPNLPEIIIERAIYFTNNDQNDPSPSHTIPPADTRDPTTGAAITERFFFYSANNNEQPKVLEPLKYAVIGSSGIYDNATNEYTTYIGRHTLTVEDPVFFHPDTNRIKLNPRTSIVSRFGQAGRSAVNIPINFHFDENGNPGPKSLTITEPVFGYDNVPPGGITNLNERYLNPALDEPLDARDSVDPRTNNSRIALNTSGTSSDFAVVHLQRLANPLIPFDKDTNPYRTIDTSSIDVTAFNGVNNTINAAGMGPLEDTYLADDLNPVWRFDSHERGEQNTALPINHIGKNNLWQQERYRGFPGMPIDGPALNVQIANHIFKYNFKATLGYLNNSYISAAGGGIDDINSHPFPWLQWNNRPFVSQFELMMVPKSRSSRLLEDYSLIKTTSTPYRVPANNGSDAAYGHLLNFFESEYFRRGPDGVWGRAADPNANPPFNGDDDGNGVIDDISERGWPRSDDILPDSTNFHRLFDYTEVPSHYAGAQTFLNPRVFQKRSVPGTGDMRPPFNRISNFRDPGRININTIFDPVVYNGLMNGHPGTPYSDWIDSRRGYGNPGVSQIILDNNKPTFFSNPLRPSGSGDIVPLPGLGRSDVDVSLFRKNPNDSQPLFDSHYPDRPRNVDRNPSFKYQSLQRLGNLVTGRSNVYGVWITVGYFEVEPAMTGPDATRPDGFRFGAEVGIDRGQIKRHRAFYMIDRSIPVAFEPGENHNVDKAVILRRYID